MNSKSMFSMALMMSAMLSSQGKRNDYINLIGESDTERQKRLSEAKIKQNKSRGLNEFSYRNGSVWALNQKSADKKAVKLNLL